MFVLDHFEAFTLPSKQSLLYNLFNLTHSPNADVALIGMTCQVDVTESLEKRIRSRFSHRQIFLPCPTHTTVVSMLNDAVTKAISGVKSCISNSTENQCYLSQLEDMENNWISILRSERFKKMVKDAANLGRSPRWYFHWLNASINSLDKTESMTPTIELFERGWEMVTYDPMTNVLQGVLLFL